MARKKRKRQTDQDKIVVVMPKRLKEQVQRIVLSNGSSFSFVGRKLFEDFVAEYE